MITGVVFEALKSLVSSRCYPNTFPQPPSIPVWPAIRYTVISSVNEADICGTDDVDTDDTRVQIDIVAQTEGAAATLRDQVIDALQSTDPPCTRDLWSESYDAETKTHRITMDFIFHGSSLETS